MYHPYFRGKQYELITIRENAKLIKESGFVPIIEPVKESLGGLEKTISTIVEVDGEIIIIVNPYHGDLSSNSESILSLFQVQFENNQNISPGILLSENDSIADIKNIYAKLEKSHITLIHAGFTDAKLLANKFGDKSVSSMRHVFFEDCCGKLYRKHFKNSPQRILLRDGFQKRTNREHPPVEFFSDLHETFQEEGMQGFGDFLIVGDDYSEAGGPAYAVAIHLTFIDSSRDNEMHVYHFKSIRQDDPKDPAGKFAEALEKLVEEVNHPNTKIFKTTAIDEFLDLHKRGHFPGLGYVKKLSMKHHIETLAFFFKNQLSD